MFVILCGKSGSGKDAICKKLIEDGYTPIISATSRPMRDGEVDGVDYNFVDKDTFLQFIEHDFLIEYRSYNTLVDNVPDTWYYGIKKEPLDENIQHSVILDLEGAKSFLDYYGDDNWCVIYIGCNDETRKERVMNRGSFDETEWNRRLADDKIKFSKDNINEIADFMILNNKGCDIKSVAYEVDYCAEIQTTKPWFRTNKKKRNRNKEITDIEDFIKEKEINKIFLDIDGVVIHSCQAMVDILNKKY